MGLLRRAQAMKVLWLSIGLVAAIGSGNALPRGIPSQSPHGLVEQEILRLNRAAAEMQVRKDVAVADRLLADDYLFLQADGNVSNKAQNLAVLRDPAFACTAFTTEDVVVRVLGDAAVITGRAIMRATYGGQDVGGEFLYTDVWAKRSGRWQTVVSQATRRPAHQ
jgi:ketosteroid isomerase-like protein